MKLLFHSYSPGHRKNIDGIRLMCASRNIELEFTNDGNRLKRHDYDIVILNDKYIDPSILNPLSKIIYGPQHFSTPIGPLCGPLREDLSGRAVYNLLSTWVSAVFNEFSPLIVPHVQFPFAVDVERFKPMGYDKSIDCIVYIKHREPLLINKALSIIDNKHLNVIKFIYGSYNEIDYLNALQKAKFMLTLDAHESQGFALEEAMSCDLPLLVVDATTMKDEYSGNHCIYGHLHKRLLCTSVPYWDERCGIKIDMIDKLSDALDSMMSLYKTFKPREYILETLSPEACMDRILNYFKLTINA